MPFGDSSYFVAIADDKDQWHGQAKKVPSKPLGRLVVTELVVVESVSIIGNRRGGKAARTLYEYFQDSADIRFVSEGLFEEAMDLHTRFDGTLSVADCLTVSAMIREGDRRIVSFDSDFDKVRGITRVS